MLRLLLGSRPQLIGGVVEQLLDLAHLLLRLVHLRLFGADVGVDFRQLRPHELESLRHVGLGLEQLLGTHGISRDRLHGAIQDDYLFDEDGAKHFVDVAVDIVVDQLQPTPMGIASRDQIRNGFGICSNVSKTGLALLVDARVGKTHVANDDDS